MSSIFILGLSDQYTKENFFQIPAKTGKSTVEFDELGRATSEIQQAKDNCLEAGGSSVCGITDQGPVEKNPRGVPVTSVTLWITVSRVMMTRSGKNFAELTSQSARNV